MFSAGEATACTSPYGISSGFLLQIQNQSDQLKNACIINAWDSMVTRFVNKAGVRNGLRRAAAYLKENGADPYKGKERCQEKAWKLRESIQRKRSNSVRSYMAGSGTNPNTEGNRYKQVFHCYLWLNGQLDIIGILHEF